MRRLRNACWLATVALCLWTAPSSAQNPPPPVAPEVISRDAEKHATVRATKLTTPLRVDGRLDEDVYRTVRPITDFIQTLPRNGVEPTERTEAWVFFDDQYIYVVGKCYDSAPPEQWIANEMRRDANQIRQNDHFGMMLDTFHDRRNGYVFYANPLGGRIDLTEADEGNSNSDWNPVWEVRTGRFDGGWTIEIAVPFKSLRYVSGTNQEWGLQIRRAIRRKNEWVHLNPLPLAMGGPQGFFRISAAATLVGLDLPPASRNVELKPYAIERVTTDRVRQPPIENERDTEFGIDAKYGVTANLTADLTVNTDFAQVEVDEQQVNLTRFNLVFPEKREFFLEGRGVFTFAPVPSTGNNAQGTTSVDTPSLFYSRRIGLNGNAVIPIDVGERLTGKAGGFGIGFLNIQTGEDDASGTEATNFTVLRVKRDILRRSSVGVMFTNRSVSASHPGSNQAMGADATLSFFQNVNVGGYYARTETTGLDGDNESYQARYDFQADRYGAHLEYLKVGDAFNPEVGFIRRTDFRRSFASARFSPRPTAMPRIRRFTYEATFDNVLNGGGDLETRQIGGRFNTEFETSDQFTVEVERDHELLVQPFRVHPEVTIPVGAYDFSQITTGYAFGQQRRASGTVSVQAGEFYDGDILAVSYTNARVSVLKQLSVEPTISVNRVQHLLNGDFVTTLLRARTDYAFSPRRFMSALLQYNSSDHTFSTNMRFRWEYRPGSELFVVYTDERNTLVPGYPDLKNRAFVVKINRLFQF